MLQLLSVRVPLPRPRHHVWNLSGPFVPLLRSCGEQLGLGCQDRRVVELRCCHEEVVSCRRYEVASSQPVRVGLGAESGAGLEGSHRSRAPGFLGGGCFGGGSTRGGAGVTGTCWMITGAGST
jgi:hypothetical protein